MRIGAWFRYFHNNIYMSSDIVEAVRTSYKAITKRINLEYWGTESEVNNSKYVGSYGMNKLLKKEQMNYINMRLLNGRSEERRVGKECRCKRGPDAKRK